MSIIRHTTASNDYDHAIVLVDSTKVKPDDERAENVSGPAGLSRTASGAPLDRRWTRGTLREELVRRKYSKWQEDKVKDGEDETRRNTDAGNGVMEGTSLGQPRKSSQSPGRTGRLRDKIPFRSKKQVVKSRGKEDTFVDILYENQRGSFFCGIPLYSGKSLLNFDPSPWQTSTFKDSPVNITNAQLPDPSWAWAWRTWYVDMSYDVDEEGWQYSFNFNPRYAWHGTHPWFHSFVRRRRWLRKRVKIRSEKGNRDPDSMKNAHLLNADYFTIHASRERSRESSAERTLDNRSSFLGNVKSESDGEQEIGDVTDILKLMAILKKARVDREKISVVMAFLDQGGDDLLYLSDKMADIMGLFVYQTSRWQLQSNLHQALDRIKHQLSKSTRENDNEDEALTRKLSNLHKAVHAAREHVNLEYLGDAKGAAKPEETKNTDGTSAVNSEAGLDEVSEGREVEDTDAEEVTTVQDENKGMPENTKTSESHNVRWDSAKDEPLTDESPEKGKGKAKE